jgi:hypothetical protein
MTWACRNSYLSGIDLKDLDRDMSDLIEHGRAHSPKQEKGLGQHIVGEPS